ncbi:uncharacterized protein LOC133316738 [Gastrolobium bilobum]|uniref:uncharacterized protein LOC133316738 n=1 Tax=Gastrolobium bilobum TaxID=150636 RepID=UPI002AB23D14|nr:uncharacterized protein LOC133316738 [Gastrolobium bilobum]
MEEVLNNGENGNNENNNHENEEGQNGGRGPSLNDMAAPFRNGPERGYVPPPLDVPNFEIKPAMFQMIMNAGQFHGLPMEDPHSHLDNFTKIVDNFKVHGISEENMRMRLFPFSVAGKAKEWRRTLPPNSITSWEQLAEQFVTRFFSQAKQAQVRADIASFQMYDGESLYEAWERFKELIRICPNHGVSNWGIIHTFYHGLTPPLKATVDAAAGEIFWILLIWKPIVQMASLQNTIKNWKPIEQKKPTEQLLLTQSSQSCSICGGPHESEDCNNLAAVCYAGGYDNNNRSNDNYQGNNNRGWKSQNNTGGSGGNYQNRPPYPRQNHQNWDKGEGKSQSFETFVQEYMN